MLFDEAKIKQFVKTAKFRFTFFRVFVIFLLKMFQKDCLKCHFESYMYKNGSLCILLCF